MTSVTRVVVAPVPGGPDALKIVERERPTPGEGQALVRVHAAGINRPDVMQREGNYPPPPGASDVLGLELAGVVEGLGPGTTRLKPGDRVMALVASGAYAEWAVVDETVALPIPDGMSFVEAGAFPETYYTVWSNLFQRAGLKAGETVLIHGGTSGIGTTAILLAKALGARVLVTAGSDEKCAASRAVGADLAINYRTDDFVAAARAATDGRGPEVILDMVGGDYIPRNLDCIAADGRIAQIAFQRGSKLELDLLPLLMKRITFTGATLRARPVAMKAALTASLAEHVLPLLTAGKAKPLIDSTFPLADVAKAHARMDAGAHVGKIVLVMQDGA
ncbi:MULTISPECIES: NAD(P)H-quinone oxidoreductase [unclassified Chelatococcus]|uniref:NAD(P)H-quinone oxidoreductase n=1 Tax=unclassified Chelatococcus TaxID=2638111 RepID=UPI001BCE25A4|nr:MULTISPECIES: NAD(P)H-quinone oxidoreductase [unclassified Chelatococcus]CAH1650389.1 putative PIG3 family NAD(P)H quinone oxidoreductase [Hyphomicrobiales bacterium]MBS7743313.1 NAD(P)H-quinone oxidoreductase [Chelatococcus sp. HY11]MBX3541569.1 NAD(P)H-quinone oxidoreductase [Chelatococcus sp.]MCO5074539.1 NAD(P)H-quinone oxidoreductase [Chelatococcus sp.]CAH1692630.1 putative PIG3 family NAD(P)H quinone oxidoreductase [Hyphomicrobiales bacterium]